MLLLSYNKTQHPTLSSPTTHTHTHTHTHTPLDRSQSYSCPRIPSRAYFAERRASIVVVWGMIIALVVLVLVLVLVAGM